MTDGTNVVDRQVASIASRWWALGALGEGMDVAIVDTGVAPVDALARRLRPGYAVTSDGPQVDRSGHGTHLAGLVHAVAPRAGIVPVRVANGDADTTPEAVVAGLEWVARHTPRHGRPALVCLLAWAGDPAVDPLDDPVARAAADLVERGVVVVAPCGNHGPGHGLASPAYHPDVLAVGAHGPWGSPAPFSADRAVGRSWAPAATRGADVLAPGVSLASLRAPGSEADRVAEILDGRPGIALGTGTSQAAAVVAGVVAALRSAHPDLSPGQVRQLMRAAGTLGHLSAEWTALATPWPATPADAGQPESAWAGSRWAGSRWAGSRWAGSRWAGSRWAGSRWAGSRWAGSRWAGSRWAGSRWY